MLKKHINNKIGFWEEGQKKGGKGEKEKKEKLSRIKLV